MAIDMRRVGIEASQVLVHDLYLSLEHIILLLRFPCEVRLSMQSVDLGIKMTFLLLGASDVVNC